MSRKLFSLAGLFIAVVGFTFGSNDAEARHCGRQRNRCCQQTSNFGYQRAGNSCCNQGYMNAMPAGQASNWNNQPAICCNQQWSGTAMRPEYGAPSPAADAVAPNAPTQAPAPVKAPAPPEAPAPASN